MKFSELHKKYSAMRQPSYTLTVGGKAMKTGEDVRLVGLDCELTIRHQAGSLYLRALLNPSGTQGKAWLDAFQLGADCALFLGYGGKDTKVFVGFIYDLNWSDPLAEGVMELEAICLDVRGRLMLCSTADAGAARTASQLVKAILSQSCCTQLTKSQTVSALPKDWDLPAQRTGTSDFSVVCDVAELLCYEFYAFADELYFGEPRPTSSPVLTFDGPNGLIALRRCRTLAGQCAAIAVSSADDQGGRLYARQQRKSDGGFGVDKIKNVLSCDLYQPEPAVRTMAQAKYLAKARMEERQRRGGGLLGQSTGLPELRPGRFIATSDMSRPINGSYYLHTVRHTLNQSGFETSFEAED